MGCALALEEGRASEVKILGNCRPCFLLWIQNADVAKNEESQGDETKSLKHEGSLLSGSSRREYHLRTSLWKAMQECTVSAF